jgi:hypothetical protein
MKVVFGVNKNEIPSTDETKAKSRDLIDCEWFINGEGQNDLSRQFGQGHLPFIGSNEGDRTFVVTLAVLGVRKPEQTTVLTRQTDKDDEGRA